MKKIATLLITSLLFFSCGKKGTDDSKDEKAGMKAATLKSRILGHWTSARVQLGMDAPVKVKSTSTLELSKTGTYTETMYGKTLTAKYELKGKKLILYRKGKPEIHTIEKLTETELVVTLERDGKLIGHIFYRRK